MDNEDSWKACAKWLTKVGLLPADHRANWPSATMRDLAYCLRDGVQLCRLLNMLCPDSLDMKEVSQRPQMAQFLCLRNIKTFLHACSTQFELKETELFQPAMLFDLSNFEAVLFTLSILSNCPKVQASGIGGFSASPTACSIDEDLGPIDDLASSLPEENYVDDYYSSALQAEEDIYQDLCYLDRRTIHAPVTVTLREKRDYVKKELLETETNYTDALNMIKKKFMKPLSKSLKEEDKKIVFFAIKELSEIHTGFLSDLNRVMAATSSTDSSNSGYACGGSTTKTLGDVFLHWKNKFIIYGDYCANLTRAQNLIDDLCAKNDHLQAEIVKCENDVNGGKFQLRHLLCVPMQRVLKYHLLLEKLLAETAKDHEEYKSIEKARDAMFDVAGYANEVKRDNETLGIIRQIEASIVDLKMPENWELKDYGRLRKDGDLKIRVHSENEKLKSRFVFMFDKVLLMCKTTRMMELLRGEQYSYKHSLCLQEYRVEDIPTTTKKSSMREQRWTHGWNLVHHENKNVYNMFAATEDEKWRWIQAIEEALSNIQPEETQRTEHAFTMHTFEKGTSCTFCQKFLKGLFYQGYKCVRCEIAMHRECIINMPHCRTGQPPQLPPRPPQLPIPFPMRTSDSSMSLSLLSPTSNLEGNHYNQSLRRSLSSTFSPGMNNLNSPSSVPQGMNGLRISGNLSAHQYVNMNELEDRSWYVGEMDRESATKVLSSQRNGTFLVRKRPVVTPQIGPFPDGCYALSLKWNDQVKHMRILVTDDGKLYYLSESRYFKTIEELIHWYQLHSLAESFSGLDACLEQGFDKTEMSIRPARFAFTHPEESPHQRLPFSHIPTTPT